MTMVKMNNKWRVLVILLRCMSGMVAEVRQASGGSFYVARAPTDVTVDHVTAGELCGAQGRKLMMVERRKLPLNNVVQSLMLDINTSYWINDDRYICASLVVASGGPTLITNITCSRKQLYICQGPALFLSLLTSDYNTKTRLSAVSDIKDTWSPTKMADSASSIYSTTIHIRPSFSLTVTSSFLASTSSPMILTVPNIIKTDIHSLSSSSIGLTRMWSEIQTSSSSRNAEISYSSGFDIAVSPFSRFCHSYLSRSTNISAILSNWETFKMGINYTLLSETLAVDSRQTGRASRRLRSASDTRQTSRAMGLTAVAVLVAVLAVFVLSDLQLLVKKLSCTKRSP